MYLKIVHGSKLKEFAISVINDYGYLGIYILTAIESVFPIVPAEVILTLGGVATTVTNMTRTGVIVFASLGELTGALFLYTIGHFFPEERLEKLLTGKCSRLIRIKKDDIEKSMDWFLKNGKFAVLFSKCIPVVGSLISIPAGMVHMNLILFILFTLTGISIWNTVLVTFGVTIKESFDILCSGSTVLTKIFALVFIACFIYAGVYLILHNRQNKRKAL